MRMKRLIALVCILLLAMGMVSFGSAEKAVPAQESRRIEFENENIYLVKNGETAKFIVLPTPERVYTMDLNDYTNIEFDTDSSVKGKVLSGSSWLQVTNRRGDCSIRISRNNTAKKRTGKIRVTGTKYSATLVFTQWGKTRIASAVRKKDTVTLKLQKGSGPKTYWLYICEFTPDYSYNEAIISSENFTGKTYKFTVRPGYEYYIEYGYGYLNEDEGRWAVWEQASSLGFLVTTISGTVDYASGIITW